MSFLGLFLAGRGLLWTRLGLLSLGDDLDHLLINLKLIGTISSIVHSNLTEILRL